MDASRDVGKARVVKIVSGDPLRFFESSRHLCLPHDMPSHEQVSSSLLFNLPHEFPTQWAAFLSGGNFSATIRRDNAGLENKSTPPATNLKFLIKQIFPSRQRKSVRKM
jgi:hypothetical protein